MKWEEQFGNLPSHIQDYIGKFAIKQGKRPPTVLKELDEIRKTHPDIKMIDDRKMQSCIAWAILYNKYFPANLSKKDIPDYHISDDGNDVVLKKIQVDDKTTIYHTFNGIHEEIQSNEGTVFKREIYRGNIEPIERLIVDGIPFFRYKAHTEQIDTMQSISQKLRNEGGVLSKNRLDDCLNAVFLDLDVKQGHATFGVYECSDKLELCLDAMPIKDLQQKILLRSEPSINQPLTRKSIEGFLKTIPFWHPYEILPNMGLLTISPFVLILRKKGLLIPILYNFAPQSHLGKSTIQKMFSQYLFSIYPQSGDDANSKYRFASIFDSICGPVVVDEADNIDFNRLSDIIKNANENYLCTSRGTRELGIKEFLSRAVIGINGNRFKIKDKTVMVRIFKIEFDMKSIKERSNEKNIDTLMNLINDLKPIGWRLVELELEIINNSMDALLKKIEMHKQEIRQYYHKWLDSRRITSWAICYEGLKIWEVASIKHGLDWRAPSYEDFVEQVISKVEQSSRETGETPLADFLHWWEMWKVRNVRRKSEYDDEIIGKDDIWSAKELEFGGEKYDGDVITNVILREYKKDKDSKIDSLADIAKTVAMKKGIPKGELLKSWDFGGSTKWGVFVPSDMWDKELDEELKKAENNDITGEDEANI